MSDSAGQEDTTGGGAAAAGQGRLAQVIATRGGRAAPEAPFVIEHREALIYMLCEAAELEHGIMCQYLFAVFSLKQSADEGLSAAELAAVTRWRTQISRVAAQEMLHLALVQNLLSAIGAAPHMSRPNLPQPANHYPAGVQLALLPFGEAALRHFMFLERPEGMDLQDAEGLAAMNRAAAHQLSERDIVPQGQDFATVGHLYRSIESGFARLAAKYGEQWLFVGPPQRAGHPAGLPLAGPGHRDRPGQRAAGHRHDPGAGRGPARALAERPLRPVRRDLGRIPAGDAGQPGVRPGPAGARRERAAVPGPGPGTADHRPADRPGDRPVQRGVRDPAADLRAVLRAHRGDPRPARNAGGRNGHADAAGHQAAR